MKKTNWLGLMLALMMCLLMLPAGAEAETVTETVTISITPAAELPDNDEIFAAYVEREMSGNAFSTFADRGRMQLNDVERAIYDVLKTKIESVAQNGGSTVTPVSGIEGLKTVWTNEELGVESIEDISAIKTAFNEQYSLADIVDALLNDCPYDLYWFEKNIPEAAQVSYQIGTSGQTNPATGTTIWTQATVLDFTFTFAVAGEFEAGNNQTVKSDVAAVAAAKTRAEEIVKKHEDKTDREKLIAYRDEICGLTSYNDKAAAGDYTGGYGNPWQLIYVFDGNDSTSVVCEGYAKAFQYLCDLSDFDGDVYCYSVSGTMSGGTGAGRHMWNIVQMNGANYLVDVTNSDGESIGQDGGLFLTTDATGTWNAQYAFTVNGEQIVYEYDEDVKAMWGDDVLKLGGHTHSYTVELSRVPATCTKEGSVTLQCVSCEETIGETIAVNSANHTNIVTVDAVAPGCDAAGMTEGSRCADCGVVIVAQEEVIATGHSWTDAACTTAKTCSVCGATEGEANGHSFDAKASANLAFAATCTEPAAYYVQCDHCDVVSDSMTVKTGEANGHKMTLTEAKASTCTEAGSNAYYTCQTCQKVFKDEAGAEETTVESETLQMVAHAYGEIAFEWDEDFNCKATYTCSVGKESVTAGCRVLVNRQEPTCTAAGKATYLASVSIGNAFHTDSKTVEIAPLAHALTKTEAKEATCVAAGSSAYYTCAECGGYFSDEAGTNAIEKDFWVIESKDHKMTLTAAKDATCTETGNNAYYICQTCQKVFKDEAGTQETTVESETLQMVAHAYGEIAFEWDDDFNCKATHTCSVGKESVTVDCRVLESGQAPTCTTAGKVTYTASVSIGNTFYMDSKTVEIAPLAHKLTKTEAKEATCVAAGSSAYYTCENCGKYFSDAEGESEIEENAWVIEARGEHSDRADDGDHSCDVCGEEDVTDHEWTDADCDAPKTCSACGKIEGEAKGHSWADASCDTPKTCSVCGKTEGEAKGHSFVDWKTITEPTCTEDGYAVKACSCGETITETLTATGHTEGEAQQENVVEATCKAEGSCSEVVRCTVCMEILTSTPKAIAKLNHTAGEAVTENKTDATCKEAGSYDEAVYCTACGEEISRVTKTISKLDTHTDENGDEVCDVCGTDLADNSVEIVESEEGKVEVSDDAPETGDQVTITITPEEGMEVEEVIVMDEAGQRIAVARMASGQYSFQQPAGKVTIQVAFKQTVTYTVSISGGSGSGSYAEGASVAISADEPESGKQFAGWRGAEGLTFASGSVNAANAIFIMPARNVELTAAYEDAVPAGCIIRFNANGGAGTMNDAAVTAGAAFALPGCGFDAPAGMQFAGWALSADGDPIASPAVFAADTTLYAVWEAIPAADEAPVINQTSGSDAAAYEGGVVTMSVSASGAASYQWYVSNGSGWTAIPGANGASYTVSVSAETSGTQYYCEVSNGNGSTSSSIFKLRVLEPAQLPQTGDEARIGLWLALMLLSAAGMTALAADRKRRAN